MLQCYASLGAVLNDDLLLEQCGILIEDHVNRRCRVTIESAVPEKGYEVDARTRLGERVKLAVHLVRMGNTKEIGSPILTITGPIVASRTEQAPGEQARHFFTVEQERLRPEDG